MTGNRRRGIGEGPVALITGAAGNIGSALYARPGDRFRVFGLDLETPEDRSDLIERDLTSDVSVGLALAQVRDRAGDTLAAVIHLAACFDFSGEGKPMCRRSTSRERGPAPRSAPLPRRPLLRHVRPRGGRTGRVVRRGFAARHRLGLSAIRGRDRAPMAEMIRNEANVISYLLLHLAGLYDDETAVLTLTQQIARIWERDMKAHAYTGDPPAGQAFIHLDDMLDIFDRAVERRDALPAHAVILAGVPAAMSYQALQDRLAA